MKRRDFFKTGIMAGAAAIWLPPDVAELFKTPQIVSNVIEIKEGWRLDVENDFLTEEDETGNLIHMPLGVKSATVTIERSVNFFTNDWLKKAMPERLTVKLHQAGIQRVFLGDFDITWFDKDAIKMGSSGEITILAPDYKFL